MKDAERSFRDATGAAAWAKAAALAHRISNRGISAAGAQGDWWPTPGECFDVAHHCVHARDDRLVSRVWLTRQLPPIWLFKLSPFQAVRTAAAKLEASRG